MGLFDTLHELGDQIYATIAMATATPASDDVMAQVYDANSRSAEDRELIQTLKNDFGYGLDAHVAVEHIEMILKLKEKGLSDKDIADVCGISEEMVKQSLQMKEEYQIYKETGKIPDNPNRKQLVEHLDRKAAFRRYEESAARSFEREVHFNGEAPKAAPEPKVVTQKSQESNQAPIVVADNLGKVKPFATLVDGVMPPNEEAPATK